jgi:hypothetical protein
MESATELFQQGRLAEIWQRYCGFLDLDLEGFMAIQNRLLEDQLRRLNGSALGRRLFGGEAPRNGEELQDVPFTTYDDYAELLLDRREDALAEAPLHWAHTSGRSGEYRYKWVPYTEGMYRVCGRSALGSFIIAAAEKRGDVNLARNGVSIYSLAPPPYVSGLLLEAAADEFAFRIYPSPAAAQDMDFQERIAEGFRVAVAEGLDYFFGMSSILLKVSELFEQGGWRGVPRGSAGHRIRSVFRMSAAYVRCLFQRRGILPRDVWRVRGVLCGGTDTSIFKEQVARSWGRMPLEIYASTEFGIAATQGWDYDTMTFIPESNYFEFITEADYHRMRRNARYKPRSYTMAEVEPDTEYVVVGTNFYGGALVRFIIGDLVRIASLENPATGVKLPQMQFLTRVDDVIDIGGFTRLTEKTIWEAIEKSGVQYVEWTARKEYRRQKPVLNLHIELRDGSSDEEVAARIHAALKALNEPYRELESMAGLRPLQVTLLSKGTFRRYYEERRATGADLGHLKPVHVNPSDEAIRNLLRMSNWSI